MVSIAMNSYTITEIYKDNIELDNHKLISHDMVYLCQSEDKLNVGDILIKMIIDNDKPLLTSLYFKSVNFQDLNIKINKYLMENDNKNQILEIPKHNLFLNSEDNIKIMESE